MFHSRVSRGLLGSPSEAVLVHLFLLKGCAAVCLLVGHIPSAFPIICQLLCDARRVQSVAMSPPCHLINI